MRSFVVLALVSLSAALGASEERGLRIAGQMMVGTSDQEVGAALEVPFGEVNLLMARPELFFNQDAKLGGGGALLWQLPIDALPIEHSMWMGPRALVHNQDENDSAPKSASGWEFDAMGIYNVPVADGHRHNVELIACLGFLQEKRAGADDTIGVGFSIGAAYAYRF